MGSSRRRKRGHRAVSLISFIGRGKRRDLTAGRVFDAATSTRIIGTIVSQLQAGISLFLVFLLL
jgi:hypothetical protein